MMGIPLQAKNSQKRKQPTDRTIYLVWAAAAGRCTLCNTSVMENEGLGEPVPIGELAHNVGATQNSPRGAVDVGGDERADAENLILVCRNCHKPIDEGGAIGRYTVEQLRQLKHEHEERIRELTKIGADRKATLLRVVGTIRGVSPELTRDTVLTAATAAGLYPQRLPGAYWHVAEADLRHHAGETDTDYFKRVTPAIDEVLERVHAGVRSDQITRVAVFGIARIPLLVHLGARLDDKVPTSIFQRHRVDTGNAWRWPEGNHPIPAFSVSVLREGTKPDHVALMMNISGTIGLEELHSDVDDTYTVYGLNSSVSGPSAISNAEALVSLERELRSFLAHVEASHGKPQALSVFLAIPVSAAVTLGRVLMPNVSPALRIYDRDEQGQFFYAFEVKR
jgi:hypothetical protein